MNACAQPSGRPPAIGAPPGRTATLPAAANAQARFVDTHSKREVPLGELATRLAKVDYVFIGELHDNAHHHLAQAQVLESIARTRKPQVLFEMLLPSQQARAQAYLATGKPAAGFGAAVSWDSGFAPFAEYQPIFEVAVQYKLQAFAANLEPDQVRTIARGTQTVSLPPLRPELQADLLHDIEVAHCGMLPPKHMEPMAQAQRARDLAMANAMLQAGQPAVLIAGRGHTRLDRGVPYVLATLAPESTRLAIALLERDADASAESAELQEFAAQADIVGYAPVVVREDPCAAFKKPREGSLSK